MAFNLSINGALTTRVVRIIQVVFAIVIIVLLGYSSSHRGNLYVFSFPHVVKTDANTSSPLRKDLQGPVAFGFISSILTIVFSSFRYFTADRPQFSASKTTIMLFLGGDIILFLCYVGTAGLLLKPKTIDLHRPLFDTPPMGSWYTATTLSVINA